MPNSSTGGSCPPLSVSFHMLSFRLPCACKISYCLNSLLYCGMITQVHDELVLEVDPSYAKEAAMLLQTSMENAVSLLGMFFLRRLRN